MYNLLISTRAANGLKKLLREHQEAIISSFEEIVDDPLLGKPLGSELSGQFSFRVGAYRIVYKVNQKDKKILVLMVGHRGKVY